MRTAVISIGIGTVGNMPHLPGAPRGAQDFADWAAAQNYDVELLTDEGGNPVDINQIMDVTSKFVSAAVYNKLIIYFSGHGVLAGEGNEKWLLSHAQERSHESVNLMLSNHRARCSGIPHVIIISDACRVYGHTVESSNAGSAIFETNGSHQKTGDLDIYYASQPGDPALEYQLDIGDANDFRGVFTECLLDALQGNISRVIASHKSPGKTVQVVDSRALKQHLSRHVPAFSKTLNIDPVQHPQINVETALPPDYFSELFSTRPLVHDATDIPRGALWTRRSDHDNTQSDYALERQAAAPTYQVSDASDPMRLPPSAFSLALLTDYFVTYGVDRLIPHTGFILDGKIVESDVPPMIGQMDISPGNESGRQCQIIGIREDADPSDKTFLIQFADGEGLSFGVFPGYIGHVRFVDGQIKEIWYVPSFIYRSLVAGPSSIIRKQLEPIFGSDEQNFYPVQGLTALNRELVEGTTLPNISLLMVRAYALFHAGALDKLDELISSTIPDPAEDGRRTMTYPFDLLLLDLRGRIPANASIAPMFPIHTQGWSLIELYRSDAPTLFELRAFVKAGRWTGFSKEGMSYLQDN